MPRPAGLIESLCQLSEFPFEAFYSQPALPAQSTYRREPLGMVPAYIPAAGRSAIIKSCRLAFVHRGQLGIRRSDPICRLSATGSASFYRGSFRAVPLPRLPFPLPPGHRRPSRYPKGRRPAIHPRTSGESFRKKWAGFDPLYNIC